MIYPINALINIYFIKKDNVKALPLLDKNYEKFHRDENFYYNYALCNAEIGDVKKVCEILSKANKIFSSLWLKTGLIILFIVSFQRIDFLKYLFNELIKN